jgi:hypothetical protein
MNILPDNGLLTRKEAVLVAILQVMYSQLHSKFVVDLKD